MVRVDRQSLSEFVVSFADLHVCVILILFVGLLLNKSIYSFGMAASMGAFLLGAGAKGKRRALPNSRIMIHQPLGGAQGQAADIEIQAKEILFIREVLNTYIAEYCDQPKDKIEEDCDRDFFMCVKKKKKTSSCSRKKSFS